MTHYPHLADAIRKSGIKLYNTGKLCRPATWHRKPSPEMLEVLFVDFSAPMPESIEVLANLVSPNLPWADEHFSERVGGEPLNPAPSHERWPFAQANNQIHTNANKEFSHTYPERMWAPPKDGIRYTIGNLGDVLELLRNEELTRQAYLPIWFPEDTGVHHGERVPCSLGYHFIIREGFIHCTYYMRSCDFFRHFRDDVYLAVRLAQWVRDQVNSELKMGLFRMDIINLHVFAGERNILPTG